MNGRRASVVVCAAMGLLAWGAAQGRAQDPKDIVWFGNSFTLATCCGSTDTVPNVFRDIAVAAGHPMPRNRNASVNGQTLQWHLDNNTNILTRLPAGEEWEHIVLQDYSTGPTHIGDLPRHLSSTLALYQEAAAISPDVVPVLYETWARGYGHPFYTGASPDFPGGPTQMQQELRDGYQMAADNIDAPAGVELTLIAPAGDAWELADFPANFYGDGNYHASNRGTLLNALVLYGTIYGDNTTSDIDLSGVLTKLNLTPADGQQLTALADAALVPEPGAGVLAAIGVAMFVWRGLAGIR